MKLQELVLCKLVAQEAFPEKGWLGVTRKEREGTKKLLYTLTRGELVTLVADIFSLHASEQQVLKAVAGFKIPKEFSIIFVPQRDTKTYAEAKRLIEIQMETDS